MITTIIILLTIILIIGYALWNQTRKISAYEETLSLYEGWIENFAVTIEKVNQDLDDLDAEGTFRSDDEVGYFYQAMYSILKRLEEFNLIESEKVNEAEDLLYENKTYNRVKNRNRQNIKIEDMQKLNRKDYKSM